MPELPELEAIAVRLSEILSGLRIGKCLIHNHLLIYGIPVADFINNVTGKEFLSFKADGKFLIIGLSEDYEIVINPMLAGRIRISSTDRNPLKSDVLSLQTTNLLLYYVDKKQMGRIYLIKEKDYSLVADFLERGPSALDPNLTLEEFRTRFKKRRGQIKNVLRNQRFVKGIGNAYADEILLYAGILPFRRRGTLTSEDEENLYNAMRSVLSKTRDILMTRELNDIALEKRDFMMIHGRGGGICPLCGNRISEVRANRFKTNYCQTCQK
ncbi:MAG: DNA-formamidopyrimidine glycosylase family protein [Candidatus Thorarchaeota archaeon]|jgi:formamidopyrimidine-DNA glycosylase